MIVLADHTLVVGRPVRSSPSPSAATRRPRSPRRPERRAPVVRGCADPGREPGRRRGALGRAHGGVPDAAWTSPRTDRAPSRWARDAVTGSSTLGLYDPVDLATERHLAGPGRGDHVGVIRGGDGRRDRGRDRVVVRHWAAAPHRGAACVPDRRPEPDPRGVDAIPRRRAVPATCPDLPGRGARRTPSPRSRAVTVGTPVRRRRRWARLCATVRERSAILPQPGHYDGGTFDSADRVRPRRGLVPVEALPSVISLTRGSEQCLLDPPRRHEVYDDDGEPRGRSTGPRGVRRLAARTPRRQCRGGTVRDPCRTPATEIDLTVRTATSMFQAGNGSGWYAGRDSRWRLRVAALDPETTLLAIAESSVEDVLVVLGRWPGRSMDSIVLE